MDDRKPTPFRPPGAVLIIIEPATGADVARNASETQARPISSAPLSSRYPHLTTEELKRGYATPR
jgi:hypothetical protein